MNITSAERSRKAARLDSWKGGKDYVITDRNLAMLLSPFLAEK